MWGSLLDLPVSNYAGTGSQEQESICHGIVFWAPLKEIVLYFMKGEQIDQYKYIFQGSGNKPQSFGSSYILLFSFPKILYM